MTPATALTDLIEVDEEVEDNLTAELLPDTTKQVIHGQSRARRKSCLDTVLCRKKLPSVTDALAVIGLKNALLIGMLSNLDLENESEADSEAEAAGAQGQADGAKVDNHAKTNGLIKSDTSTLPKTSNKYLARQATVMSKAESISISTSVSSSEDSTTPPNEPRKPQARDPSSFATLMFARNAPKLSPKELLSIPLTVPPVNTPPPKIKYTIAGVKRSDTKRKSFKSGRSYISIHSSSSETLVDDTRIVVTDADAMAREQEMRMVLRRHSNASTTERGVSSDSSSSEFRRHSMQPDTMRKTVSWNCEEDSETPKLSPVRQATLQVPPFLPNFSNRLTVPAATANFVIPQPRAPPTPQTFSPAPVTTSTTTASVMSRRRLRAQQLRRQKSVDVTTQDESTEESSNTTSPITSSFSSRRANNNMLCTHCAKSLDHLDKFLWNSSEPHGPARFVGTSNRRKSIKSQSTEAKSTVSTSVWLDSPKTRHDQSNVKVTHL